MREIKSGILLIICLSIIGLVTGRASAQQEILLPIGGGVYHMITSPVLPQDPDPQVSLTDDLGAYDKTQWRLFRYNPANSSYDELKSPLWDPIEDDFNFGRGYWIISRNTITIDVQGDPTVVNQITLKSDGDGWNQIGNIYLQDFTIGMSPNCNLRVAPVGGPSYQLNDLDNPYTHVTLKEYIGGISYADIGDDDGEMLETGKGYWLKNISGQDVILSFDPVGLTSVSTTSFANFPSQDFFIRVAQQEDPPDPPPSIESSFSVSYGDGSSSGGGGCFIATAAYGDYYHPRVQLLREFRDRYLSTNSIGRFFMDMYYRNSPILANFMVKCKPIKALVRFTLVPVIGISAMISKMNTDGLLMVLCFSFLGSFLFLRLRRGVWEECNLTFSGREKEGKRKI